MAAHVFELPSRIPSTGTYGRENQRQKSSQDTLFYSSRSESVSSNNSSSPASSTSPTSPSYRNSALSAHRNPSIFSTRSIPGSPVVSITRSNPNPPSDNDIIIVTVKLSNNFRKSSLTGAENLPDRPRPRGFLGRMKTRVVNGKWDHTSEREEKYKAVKMPRSEYKKFFRKDAEGRFCGTEEEREWDDESVEGMFGQWRDVPIGSPI